jgi:acyl-CoA thioesterase FadM
MYYKKETGVLVAEGYTVLAFIKTETKKAVRPPEFYVKAIGGLIEELNYNGR